MAYFLVAYLLLGLVLSVWAIFDVLTSEFVKTSTRFRYLLMIFIFPAIGALLYFWLKRKINKKEFKPQFNK